MSSLSLYKTAYRMNCAGSSIQEIALVVQRDRATVYRWLKGIRLHGIQNYERIKKTCKHRRQGSRTPVLVENKIVDIRDKFGWCGQKIKKELQENHLILISNATIYRILHKRFTKRGVGVKPYFKHQAIVKAYGPKQVVEHDTVDLGGGKYAYTSIDVFTKEPVVVIATDLTMQSGKNAFLKQKAFYGKVDLHQSDNGSEFKVDFVDAVIKSGSKHRYSRPYKKNEQSHIENFNRSLRSECFQWRGYEDYSVAELQKMADDYCSHWINRRWHMGLPNLMTPAQFIDYYRNDQMNAIIDLTRLQEKRYGKRKSRICG
jgi:IS30 family transposase